MAHKKPRWIGPAASKKFLLPPTDHTPPDDIEQLLALSWQHRERLSAISQLLYEDFLRHSDVGSAAIEEAKREEEEHVKLLDENEQENARVAKQRELRLQREAVEREEKIRNELLAIEREKLVKERQLEQLIREESKELDQRIKLEDLERAIEIALDNPVDHEFAIDTKGFIYRGRETKSLNVPPREREKIPVPPTTSESILKERKN